MSNYDLFNLLEKLILANKPICWKQFLYIPTGPSYLVILGFFLFSAKSLVCFEASLFPVSRVDLSTFPPVCLPTQGQNFLGRTGSVYGGNYSSSLLLPQYLRTFFHSNPISSQFLYNFFTIFTGWGETGKSYMQNTLHGAQVGRKGIYLFECVFSLFLRF